jgi:hypothetical protein
MTQEQLEESLLKMGKFLDEYLTEDGKQFLLSQADTKANPLKPLVSQAACGHWQKGKPKKECYFVYRDNKEDNYPSLYEAKLDENILCVFNIQDDEFIYTMEEMADGEFFIIEK